MCSEAQDTTKQDAIATKQVDLSAEQLAWAKQIYADTAPQRAQTQDLANRVGESQITAMNTQTNIASDIYDRQKTVFNPLEDKIVADSQTYDTPEKRAAAAAAAEGNVGASFDAQRAAAQREAMAVGVDPSSGNFAATASTLAATRAAQGAAAGNAASDNVGTVGRALKMDAASLGRGLPSSQATTAGLALTAGNGAVGSSNTANVASTSGTGLVQQGYAGAGQGLTGAANIYGQQAQQQAGIDSSNQSGMFAAGSTLAAVGIAI